MPWHAVQFLRITSHTGPSGLCTFGRVALPPICAARGSSQIANRKTRSAALAEFLDIDLEGDRFRAGTKALPFNAVLVEDAQQHIGGSLRVIGVSDVAIPLEVAVDPAQQDDGHFHVRMPV